MDPLLQRKSSGGTHKSAVKEVDEGEETGRRKWGCSAKEMPIGGGEEQKG